ncbi:MAG: ATP-binding protein [Janthinobacterium lividum]
MSIENNDWFYSKEQFRAFFEKSDQSLLMKADLPNFNVLAVSNKYLALTHKQRNEVLGKNLFEVFPGSAADPNEKFSVFSSFQKVIDTKMPHELPTFKYEIFVPDKGRMETQYWSNLNEPILDSEGNVAYIINTTTNITEQILHKQAHERATLLEESLAREQLLNEELASANEELHAINEELQQSQYNLALLNFELEERIASRTKALAKSEGMMQSAIASAKLGTWFINVETKEFVPCTRTKELFGFYPTEVISYEAVIRQITDEYRDQVVNTIETAIQQGESYDMEYPVIGFHNGKLCWLKATGKLYQAEAEKQAHFSGTLMDITERRMEDIRKNGFIAIVSHELKTPLTSLKAYVQMLAAKAKKAEDPFTTVALNKVNVQVKKMTTLINSFLHISQLESGKIHLDKTNFDLVNLVQDRVEEISLTTKSHTIYFQPCKPLLVYADEEKIGQVINNLISNAIKYSVQGKYIDISCENINGKAQVRVKDEGVGVPIQDKNRIFERYYRVENNQTKTISGFGIGLYLCSEIIKHHNGEIYVESESKYGSTFCFNLPLGQVEV